MISVLTLVMNPHDDKVMTIDITTRSGISMKIMMKLNNYYGTIYHQHDMKEH